MQFTLHDLGPAERVLAHSLCLNILSGEKIESRDPFTSKFYGSAKIFRLQEHLEFIY